MSEDVDRRLWHTELLTDNGGWTLRVRRIPTASTREPLTNGQAHDWARQQLGEGVSFEPVLMDLYVEPRLGAGDRIDWVATPEQGRPTRP